MKALVKKFQWLFILILLFSVGGCAFPNPSKPEDTLVIGGLTLEAEGWPVYISSNINGKHVTDVFMYLLNCGTKQVVMCRTDNYGFFYRINLKPGTYIMKSFSYEMKGDDARGSVVSLSWEPSPELPQIQVNPGQVLNLGNLRWVANKRTKTYQLAQDADSTKTLNAYFAEHYPKSLWLQREWVEAVIQTSLNQNPPEFDCRATNYYKKNSSKE